MVFVYGPIVSHEGVLAVDLQEDLLFYALDYLELFLLYGWLVVGLDVEVC